MTTAGRAPPATIVVFGAMGDLAQRLLAPALANLAHDKLLDESMALLGIGRQDADDEKLRSRLDHFVDDDAAWQGLRNHIAYLKGDFTKAATFNEIARKLSGNIVFYLATAPEFFGPIVDSMADAGLLDQADGFRRVVIEKPFGTDLASAQALMGPLSSIFDLLTFGGLIVLFHVSPPQFRTAWFLESMATQILVIFVIRTNGRPWRNLPRPILAATSLGALIIAMALPFTPVGGWFGFQPPPLLVTVSLGLVVIVYLACAELLKQTAIRQSGRLARSGPRA